MAVFTPEGELKQSLKFPTPSEYPAFVDALAENIALLDTHEFIAASVAVPGRIDRTNGIGIAFGNRPWENVPIGPDIAKILGCPVTLENDAKLAGLHEASYILETYKKVLYVTISTGIGGGLIIDGMIDPNFQDIEIGQLLLEHDGRLTDWEDFGSGRAFQEKFGKPVSEIDPEDGAAWYYIARNIAIGLIDLIVTLTPQAIVLGGGAGSNYAKFKDRLDEQLKIYENPLVALPAILPAQRPNEAVIYGCYDLLKAQYENTTPDN